MVRCCRISSALCKSLSETSQASGHPKNEYRIVSRSFFCCLRLSHHWQQTRCQKFPFEDKETCLKMINIDKMYASTRLTRRKGIKSPLPSRGNCSKAKTTSAWSQTMLVWPSMRFIPPPKSRPQRKNRWPKSSCGSAESVRKCWTTSWVNSRLAFAIFIQTKNSAFSAGFFWTFAKKLKVKKTETQAQKTQNWRIFYPKLKIPEFFL